MGVIAFIIFLIIATGAGVGLLTASVQNMPTLQGNMQPNASSQIFDIHGHLITTIHSDENRLPVSIQKTPSYLQEAFIATEDARFYQHWGLDPKGILRAIWSNITGGGISEGASTITQQLARNAFLSQDRTLKRKIQEAFLALEIERKYTKNEILEMYMNQIYFGQGAYGVQAASQLYFGKNVGDLSLAEAAMIAGLPQSPNYYSPLNNMKAAKQRQEIVLDQMVKYQYINPAEATAAKKQEIVLAKHTKSPTSASYFIDYVIQQLISKYGADAVYKQGLKIYTTLDLDMQQAAEKSMQELPVFYTDKNGLKQPQGALIAIEPQTGHIKAMVGGRGNDQFNRSVLAERQPGSAFKPFVYLAALENGMTPATVIDDSSFTLDSWSPQNYDRQFRGKVTLRHALQDSLNVVTVKIANHVGVDKPLEYAQKMGISTLVLKGARNDRNLAMALGGLSKGVTPIDIASAYGVLANQGVRVPPIAITKVIDRSGRVLEESSPKPEAVVSDKSAYILTDMMKSVMNGGTGTAANIGRPAAGKTGTTDNYTDAWFVGFTPDLVCAVWMGSDTNESLQGITGGDVPAHIWHDFMAVAANHYPARDFPRPAGITSVTISAKDGLLAAPGSPDSYSEVFIEGTQPSRYSNYKPNDKDQKDSKDNKKNKTNDKKDNKSTKDTKDTKNDKSSNSPNDGEPDVSPPKEDKPVRKE